MGNDDFNPGLGEARIELSAGGRWLLGGAEGRRAGGQAETWDSAAAARRTCPASQSSAGSSA